MSSSRRRNKNKQFTSIDDTEEYDKQLKSYLQNQGLYYIDIPTDGSCLFHSISDQFYGNTSKNKLLRQQSCDYIQSNAELYENFLDDETMSLYINRMRNQSTYGGHIELSAISNIYKVNIKVIQVDFEFIITPNNIKTDKYIHLAYHNYEHYSSIRFNNTQHAGLLKDSISPDMISSTADQPRSKKANRKQQKKENRRVTRSMKK